MLIATLRAATLFAGTRPDPRRQRAVHDRAAVGRHRHRRRGDDAERRITHPSFLVLYPFQDGTPYRLETAPRSIDVDGDLVLGDIDLVLRTGGEDLQVPEARADPGLTRSAREYSRARRGRRR